MRFRGKLLDEGKIVVGSLSGTIEQYDTGGGVIGWKGRLDLDKPLAHQEYEILFDDGRRAAINVFFQTIRAGQKPFVPFEVNGGIDAGH